MSTLNNLDNTYYQGRNHIRLSKDEVTRNFIEDQASEEAALIGKEIVEGARGIGTPAPFILTITGLSTDSRGLYGPPGGHASIGYTVTDLELNPIVLDSVKWSNVSNPIGAATYGTGANPTDYDTAFGSLVWLHGTKDGVTVSKAFQVRQEPSFQVQPTILEPFHANNKIYFDIGAADFATIDVSRLTFNGVDIIDRIDYFDDEDNPTTPSVLIDDLFVYGATNTLVLETVAFNQFGSVASNLISETVFNVPSQPAAPSLVSLGTSSISIDSASSAQDGGAAILGRDYQWTTNINLDPIVWTTVTDAADPATLIGLLQAQQVWIRTANKNIVGSSEWSPIASVTTDAGVPADNPVFEGFSFVTGGGGTPDKINALGYAYGGADTVDFFGVSSTSAVTPSTADIEAGLGTGTLEAVTLLDVDLTTLNALLSGLTSVSNVATHFHGHFKERNNGGISIPRTVAVSGLNFTAPVPVDAYTNTLGTQTTIQFSKTLYGTYDPAEFVLEDGGIPVTKDTIVLNDNLLIITHAAFVDTDVVTLTYTGTSLKDDKGNVLATFVDYPVQNNTLPAVPNWVITVGNTVAAVETYPTPPTTPAWSITVGNGSATATSYPGQV